MEIYNPLKTPASKEFEKLLNSKLSKTKIEEGKIIDGKIKCNLYKEDTTFIESLIIDSGMLIIQYEGIHEYEMIEKSKVLEVKNGPYFGPDKDRTRVNVKKD